MTRLMFEVFASSFATNMALRLDALSYFESHPLATQAVLKSFYANDSLMGADSIHEGIQLRRKLQDVFHLGGFPTIIVTKVLLRR